MPTWLIVVIIVVAVVVALAMIAAVEVSTLFATNQQHWETVLLADPGVPSTVTADFPVAVAVSGYWSSVGTGWVNFSISNLAAPFFVANATQGTFSFVANGFGYTFEVLSNAYESVTIEVTYTTHGWGF